MANITISIPDDHVVGVIAALRDHYGAEAAGKTNRELIALHLRKTLEPIYRAYLNTHDAQVVNSQASLVASLAASESAAATEAAARRAVSDALEAAAANSVSDLSGIA